LQIINLLENWEKLDSLMNGLPDHQYENLDLEPVAKEFKQLLKSVPVEQITMIPKSEQYGKLFRRMIDNAAFGHPIDINPKILVVMLHQNCLRKILIETLLFEIKLE